LGRFIVPAQTALLLYDYATASVVARRVRPGRSFTNSFTYCKRFYAEMERPVRHF